MNASIISSQLDSSVNPIPLYFVELTIWDLIVAPSGKESFIESKSLLIIYESNPL